MRTLEDELKEAARRDAARDSGAAADLLDRLLAAPAGVDPALRFRALLLRAEVAVNLNDSGFARGVLAEAFQALRDVNAAERAALSSEQRRADDLETFLTHRGCAG